MDDKTSVRYRTAIFLLGVATIVFIIFAIVAAWWWEPVAYGH